MKTQQAFALCILALKTWAVYVPLNEYAGESFFNGWDYYGSYDNTTWGNVTFLDRGNATTQRLTYINEQGNAIIKVDNTTTVLDGPLVYRNSIRLTSQETYGVRSLIVFDALHMPYGCSVWPSFWTLGVGEWPESGEIDIVEGINMMTNNQMALHTTPGCMKPASSDANQTGSTLEHNCSLDQGCIVAETKANSYGEGFARAGGGVFAVQIDVKGVFMWFWSRPDVPTNIRTATSTSSIDISSWGLPSAAYPSVDCDIEQFFKPQQLILLITLCGTWAGIPGLYASTCPGDCYADNIIGLGSPKYDNAYFEIPYIRVYRDDSSTPPPTTPTGGGQTTVIEIITSTAESTQTSTIDAVEPSGAAVATSNSLWIFGALVGLVRVILF